MTTSRTRWLDLSVALFAAGALFAVLGGTAADPDLWGHVRFGQLMYDLGFIPRHDPYAYTEAGRTWINHEWLAEWLFGRAWEIAGAWGLVIFKLGFVATVFGLAADHLRRRGVGVVLLAIMLLLAALAMRTGFPNLRPHLFTSLFLLVVLLVLRASRRRPGALWFLPPTFAVWINVHGGVLAGMGIAGIWFLADRVELWTGAGCGGEGERRASLGTWIAVGLTSAAALLLNPYGWELPRFLLETATVPRPFIQEWVPVHLSSAYGVVYLLLLAAGAALLILSRRRLGAPEAAVLAVGALLPFVAIRHLALFALIWLVTLADSAADVWARIEGRRGRERRGGADGAAAGRLRAAAIAALLFGAVGLAVDGARGLGCVKASGPETIEYPRETVRYLADTSEPYRLAVYFAWGEYAIWHLGPRVQVAIDGRRETVYPDSVYRAYLALETGRGDWSRHLESPPADLVLVEKAGSSANLLEIAPAWTRWMEGSAGVLYARGPALGSLPAPPERQSAVKGSDPAADRQWCFPE